MDVAPRGALRPSRGCPNFHLGYHNLVSFLEFDWSKLQTESEGQNCAHFVLRKEGRRVVGTY